ncbi:MAG: alpha/beta fold hydrolase [Pseudomonadota bacterium]
MRDRHLFPDAQARTVSAGGREIFTRLLGSEDGPPLLLLHGFPQTGALWADVAPRLLREGGRAPRLVIPDLPGYGRSREARFALGSDPEAMSKRALAAALVEMMARLGWTRFDLAGHDRGGRVAYRMALDHPAAVRRLATLDITPTLDYWARAGEAAFAVKIYHWAFLAQPAPLPERMIAADPDAYIDHTLRSWRGDGALSGFAPAALEAYRANARDPAILGAMCDDYRAGAAQDVEHDAADRASGRKIAAPMLALWGDLGVAKSSGAPLDIWRRWCDRAEGAPVACGHFLPEEAPAETAARLAAFFGAAA